MPKPTSPERLHVAGGIAAGIALSTIFILGAMALIGPKVRAISHGAEALAFLLAIITLPLLLGVELAGFTRFLRQNIDGSEPDAGTFLDVTRRYLQNTVEQTVLFALACLSAHYALGDYTALLLPIMAVWFCIARMLFLWGYTRQNPLHRAVGFASTFYPTLGLILFTVAVSTASLFGFA